MAIKMTFIKFACTLISHPCLVMLIFLYKGLTHEEKERETSISGCTCFIDIIVNTRCC